MLELPSDAVAKLWDDSINKNLFELVHGKDSVEKLGGLLAIGACILGIVERLYTEIWNRPSARCER